MVGRLNHVLRGWANYFRLGTVSAAYNDVNAHVCYRLRRWLTRKFKLRGPQWSRHSDRHLHETLGLLRLRRLPAPSSSANARSLVREPDAANPHVRFDEREVE